MAEQPKRSPSERLLEIEEHPNTVYARKAIRGLAAEVEQLEIENRMARRAFEFLSQNYDTATLEEILAAIESRTESVVYTESKPKIEKCPGGWHKKYWFDYDAPEPGTLCTVCVGSWALRALDAERLETKRLRGLVRNKHLLIGHHLRQVEKHLADEEESLDG